MRRMPAMVAVLSAELRHIALRLRYDGSRYHGWQVQKNAVSVCETVQKALAKMLGHPAVLTGCGRTDTGVHALHYVADFKTSCSIPLQKIPLAMAALLPEDIAVWEALDVPSGFHATFSCVRKEYTYRLFPSRTPDPFIEGRAYRVCKPLDIDAMIQAASRFMGTHDFAAFRGLRNPTPITATVRTVMDSSLQRAGPLVIYRVAANGFLYNMARVMAGTLYYVGLGRLTPDDIPLLLAGGDRRLTGPTLPPQGLYMTGADYDPPLAWQTAPPAL